MIATRAPWCIGVLRLPAAYMRAQAAARPGPLGPALIFAAVAVRFGDADTTAKSVGLNRFAFLAVPIGAHVITRAAHESGVPIGPPETTDELPWRGQRTTPGPARVRPAHNSGRRFMGRPPHDHALQVDQPAGRGPIVQ